MNQIDDQFSLKENFQEFKSRFFIFSAIIGLFTFPIIQANVIFADDRIRTFEGFISQSKAGRYLAELFFSLINFSGNLSDAETFFQIASIFVLAAPIALLSLILKYNRLSASLALPFIVCTPFFLQNLSYRYDSITMAFSVALAILAVCAQLKHKYLYTVLCIFGLLGFYQASLSAFLVLSCMVALLGLFEASLDTSIIYIFKAYLCGLIALILYKIQIFLLSFIPGETFSIHGYGLAHNKVNYNLSHILQNIIGGLKYCCVDFNHGSVPLVLTACAIISLVFLFTKLFKASTRQNKPQKILFILWGLMLVLLGVVSIIGPMAILDNMVIEPRVMIGIGSFLALCVSFFLGKQASWSGWKRPPVALAAFMLIQVLFGAFIYGNILKKETEFDEDLSSKMFKKSHEVQIKAKDAPYSDIIDTSLNHQPWIKDIIKTNREMIFEWHKN